MWPMRIMFKLFQNDFNFFFSCQISVAKQYFKLKMCRFNFFYISNTSLMLVNKYLNHQINLK